MKIKQVHIKEIKRFSDLTIDGLLPTTKLVVLVGPNGCGKTSVFEAFNHWQRWYGWGNFGDESYFVKKDLSSHESKSGWYSDAVKIDFHDRQIDQSNKASAKGVFYFRGAYRNEPDVDVKSLSRKGDPLEDTHKPLIFNDSTVSDDYQRLVLTTVSGVYDRKHDAMSVPELRENLVGKLQCAVSAMFPDLQFLDIGDPSKNGTFYFKKGVIEKYLYKNLSAGEKAAFDLLLDLIIKSEYYPDAVFCIDEPEAHMHTALQGKVLDELCSIIPDKSQLWIATHSIGMIKKARDIEHDKPGTVAFLDFGGRDFDIPQRIVPSGVNRSMWNKVLELALDDMSGLVAPKTIIFCEGDPAGGKNKCFDAEVYNKIFAAEHPDAIFVSIGSCTEIEDDKNITVGVIKNVFKESHIIKLVDRDDYSYEEVEELKSKGIKVLLRRHIEACLFDDEIITALCKKEKQDAKAAECIKAKNDAIAGSIERGNPVDDVKSASGAMYNDLKRILQLTRCGNNTYSFLRDTIAPLVTPDTAAYKELEKCIFG